MTPGAMIMFAVATVFCVVGAGLLLALTRPRSPGQVYAFRMVGIMALAGGIVLGMSAYAMWQWASA